MATKCPPVQWDETTMNRYLNKVHKESWPTLNYTVLNPDGEFMVERRRHTREIDLGSRNVQLFIQWRKLCEVSGLTRGTTMI